uniref:Uncharacterized protein n=1 Tax=Amphimedon queenslandica TaxID=400682 RepID=A0A1X7T6A9_AMPQE
YKPIKTSRSVYVERPLGVSTLYKKRLLPFMVRFSMEHVFTLAQRFVLASLVFFTPQILLCSFLTATLEILLSYQFSVDLNSRRRCVKSRCEVLVSLEDGPPGSVCKRHAF